MIRGDRVNARFHIGKILQKKRSHVRVDAVTAWHRCIGMRAPLRFRTLSLVRTPGEAAQCKTMSEIPSDARRLVDAIGNSGDDAGKWSTHVLSVATLLPYRLTQMMPPDVGFAPPSTRIEIHSPCVEVRGPRTGSVVRVAFAGVRCW